MTKALWAAGYLAACLAFGVATTDPNAERWAVVYVLSAGAVISICWSGIEIKRTHIWALALFAWAWMSLLWSPDWREGLNQAKDATAILAVFLWASRSDLSKFDLVATLLLLCAIFLGFKYSDINGGFGNENFQSEFMFMAIPLAFLGWTKSDELKKLFIVGVAICAVLYLFAANKSDQKYAVLAAIGAAAFVYSVRQKHWKTAGAFLSVGLISVPFLWSADIVSSVEARIEFFWNTLAMWSQAPILGHGWGSFNYVYPTYQQAHNMLLGGTMTRLGDITIIAGNAHNEVLQIGSELGMVGIVIALCFGYRLFTQGGSPAVLSCLFVTAVLSMIGFPLRNPATALLAATAAGVAIQKEVPLRALLPSHRALAVPAGVLVSACLIVGGGFWYFAQVHFSLVRSLLLSSKPDSLAALHHNLEAIHYFPFDRAIRHQLILTVRAASKTKNVNLDPNAADRAYQISRSTAERSPDTEFARVEYLFNSGRWVETDEIDRILNAMMKSVPHLPQTWYSSAVLAYHRGNLALAKVYAKKAMKMNYVPQELTSVMASIMNEPETPK